MNYAALADELLRLLDENPRNRHEEQISATLRGEMAVMRLLVGQGDQARMAAGEISRQLGMSTSRIAAVLNSLEKKKMIARHEDPRDRRRVMVSLTREGWAFHEKKRGHIRAHMASFLEKMGREDAEVFVRLMKRAAIILASEPFVDEKDDCIAGKSDVPKEEIYG